MSVFNLKSLREQAGLTQTSLSKRLSISQVQISRYESNPDTVPIGLINEYLEAIGLDLPTAIQLSVQEAAPTAMQLPAPATELTQRIDLACAYMDMIQTDQRIKQLGLLENTEFCQLLKHSHRKPTILMAGHFDAGKSHLVNTLLGARYLPTGYQPETRLVIQIHHISDKPEFMSEDVWIMKKGFEQSRWQDETHCQLNKITAGNTQTLKEWASHKYPIPKTKESINNDLENNAVLQDAGSVLLFLDAPVLRGCTIIDVPGDLNSQNDDLKTVNLDINTDILIYTSNSKGFMSSADITHLNMLFNNITPINSWDSQFPSLGNIYIVATHADPSLSDKQIQDIISGGLKRLESTQNNHSNIDYKILNNRCFKFWSETLERSDALKTDLQHLLSQSLPIAFARRLDNEVTQLQSDIQQRYSQVVQTCKTLEKLLLNKSSHLSTNTIIDSFSASFSNEEQTVQNNISHLEASIINKIDHLKNESIQAIDHLYDSIVSADNIEKIIQEQFPESQDAKLYASGFIFNLLQVQIDQVLTDYYSQLESLFLAQLIENSNSSLTLNEQSIPISLPIPLNIRGFFFGSMASLAGITPMAAWASTLGTWGGYLVLAESTAALGFSTSMTATAVTTVAAIGGPGIFATGLLIAGAALGSSFMGTSWEKRLSNTIIKHFSKHQLKQQFLNEINIGWEQFQQKMSHQLQAIGSQQQDYVHSIYQILSDSDAPENDISKLIQLLEKNQSLFASLPWKTVEKMELNI